MSATKKLVKVTVEYNDAVYELEADKHCSIEYDMYEGSRIVVTSSKMFTHKPNPEPEPAKANVSLEIEIGGKRYAGKLEEKPEVKKPDRYSLRYPLGGWTFTGDCTY